MFAMLRIEIPVEDIELLVALFETLLLDRRQLIRLQMHQALFRAHVLQFAICVCQVLDLLNGRHQVLFIVYLQLPDCIERELKRFE